MGFVNKGFTRRLLLVSTALLIAPQFALAWGEIGHGIVAKVGSDLSSSGNMFWKANDSSMAVLTTMPDVYWKSLPTANVEKPTHFFQPDGYFDDPSQFGQIPENYSEAVAQHDEAFVVKNGTSVWRAPQFYQLAVKAVQNHDYVLALQMAGVMSHYVGDMSQPLHDTANYDGQMTGQVGIHAFFETANIKANNGAALVQAVEAQAQALLQDADFVSQVQNGSIEDVVFKEVARAYQYKDSLLAIDKKQGRTGAGAKALIKLATSRMADGAATLAILLSRIWVDAGNPDYGVTVDAPKPAWVAPEYDGLASLGKLTAPVASLLDDDDCLK